jgi:hypothetical protein
MKSILAGLAAAALWTGSAAAQLAPPMDMSWALRSQLENQMMGDWMAEYARQQYLAQMMELRRRGYAGPSLPTGIAPGQLQSSIKGANDATEDTVRSWQGNSDRRSRAIEQWGR